MPEQLPKVPATSTVRELAKNSLSRYANDSAATIRETFLFENDHYTGVRYVLGQFCFEWKKPDHHASISRGDLIIQTVDIFGESEIRRAA